MSQATEIMNMRIALNNAKESKMKMELDEDKIILGILWKNL
ncbi:MAG: hypothetical protein ACYSTS_15895 [Planctomycetota bacterium]|jgi:hypothetical protein